MNTKDVLRSSINAPLETSKVLDDGTKELLAMARTSGSSSSGCRDQRLQEFLTLDQFTDSIKYIPKRYTGPNAFCGATSPANALALLDAFEMMGIFSHGSAKTGVSGALIMDVARSTLCPANGVPTEGEPIVVRFEDAMGHYCASRTAYIQKNPAAFDAPKRKRGEVASTTRGLRSPRTIANEKLSYRRNWIANYEVSDFLRERTAAKVADKSNGLSAPPRKPNGESRDTAIDIDADSPAPSQQHARSQAEGAPCAGRLLFFRKNQWPVREFEATHEEYDRMEEEQRFGGVITNPETGEVRFRPEDCSVFVEEPAEKLLLKPAEYLHASALVAWNVVVGVVDLDGHFATIVSFCDADNGNMPTSILFNTVKGYGTHPMFVACHDLLITPKL